MAKPKTIAAIEPNVGLRNKLAKRITQICQALTKYAERQIVADLLDKGLLQDAPAEPMGMDAAPELTPHERALLAQARRSVRVNDPAAAVQHIDAYVAERLARWMIAAGENARAVSYWFVRAVAQNVTASQRRALTAAGISPAQLRERWSVPLVRQHVSPAAAKLVPEIVDTMTGLITKMQADDLSRLRETMVEGIQNGQSMNDIETILKQSKGFTEARAKRVALDQSCKVNQSIQRANAKDLGIKSGFWVHIPGRYSSRPTHVDMNGKEFNLDEGLYDSAVEANVLPGQLPFSRCSFRLKLPAYSRD